MRVPRHGFVFALLVTLAAGQVPSPALSQTSAAPPDAAQLQKLVAPIALYPDPLVAQILPASTYPVQVVEAARALANGARPDKATAAQWDPSIQSLISYPTVLKTMSDRISWTTQLGQAVAAMQPAAIKRSRQSATSMCRGEASRRQPALGRVAGTLTPWRRGTRSRRCVSLGESREPASWRSSC